MRNAKRASIAAILAAAAIAGAQALEFGVDAIAGNLQFPWEDTAPIADPAFPNDNYFWGGSAWLRSPLGDDAAIRFSVDRDPVLRNSASALVEFERGIAKISAGPYFGFLNTEATPFSAGISATVRLQWPGVAFLSMRSDGATAISLFGEDSAPQAHTEISAGFYVPHAIVSAVVSAKRFNETLESGTIIADSLMRYAMEVEIFKKNVPYTLFASIGYEQRSKRFEAADAIDSLGAVMIGVETAARIGPALKLTTGFDTGVYVFGMDELADQSPGTKDLFFRAGLGFSLDLAALPPRPPKIEKPKAEKPAEEAPAEEAPAAAEPEPEKAAKKPADFSKFTLDLGGGYAYYGIVSLDIPGAELLELLLNSRLGARIGIGYRILPVLKLGLEAGCDYFGWPSDMGYFNAINIPARAVAGVFLGSTEIDAFGGLSTLFVGIGDLISPAILGIEAGGRVKLGIFYAEGSYIFSLDPSVNGEAIGIGITSSFFRIGTGVSFKLK